MPHSLYPDEALIQLKSKQLVNQSVDIYKQVYECFGCPLHRLTTLTANSSSEFVVPTKHDFQLEIRNSLSGHKLCTLDNLGLSSQSKYEIEIDESKQGCQIRGLTDGECLLCPIGLVLCLILLITAAEKFYSVWKNPAQDDRRVRSKSVSSKRSSSVCESRIYNRQVEEEEVAERLDDVIAQGDATEPKSRKRFHSLDVFRGVTITAMIMVNNGGGGYSFLEHKPWQGLTLADLVFPFFIFSMGACIPISSKSMMRDGKSFREKLAKIMRRSLVLFLIGICLNSKWLRNQGFEYLRITGVLQRFSISYLVVSLAHVVELTIEAWIDAQSLTRRPWLSRLVASILEILTAFNCIAIYLYFTFFYDYQSGCPRGYLGPGGETENGQYTNCTGGAAGWLDRRLLGPGHLYNNSALHQIYNTDLTVDPEGVLGYTMSILLTLIGLQAGKIIISQCENKSRLFLLSGSTIALALVSTSAEIIPVNKTLWSLTFVTITGSLAFLVLTSLFLTFDVYKCDKVFLIRLFISAGRNSILLYVGHSIFNDMLPWYFKVNELSRLQVFLRLCWSTLVWLFIAHYLDMKGIYIKV